MEYIAQICCKVGEVVVSGVTLDLSTDDRICMIPLCDRNFCMKIMRWKQSYQKCYHMSIGYIIFLCDHEVDHECVPIGSQILFHRLSQILFHRLSQITLIYTRFYMAFSVCGNLCFFYL